MKQILFILALSLSACMSADKHLQKFYKKGGKIEQVERVVTITDTIKGKDGKDSIIYREISLDCPQPIAPITKWKLRFDNRRFRDSLNAYRKMYKDSLRYGVKQAKIEAKRDIKVKQSDNKVKIKEAKATNRKFNWWIIGILYFVISMGIILLYAIFRKMVNK